jgi:hypothetical protein
MPKFRLLATQSVGYEIEVEAPNQDAALELASTKHFDEWSETDSSDWRLDDVQELDPAA